MNILAINKFFYPKGGPERYLRDLSRFQRELGHNVVPFAMNHPENWPSEYSDCFVSQVDLEQVKSRTLADKVRIVTRILWSRHAQKKLKLLLSKSKPDVAHMHMIEHQISPSILPVLRRNQIPAIMTAHAYGLICPNQLLRSGDSNCEACNGHRYYNAVLKKCVKASRGASFICAAELYLHSLSEVYKKNISLFIAPSNFMRDKLVAFGFDSSKVVVIPNFVNLDRFNPSATHGEYILYVGRLVPEKGVLTLIKAVRELKDVELIVAGTGPQEEELVRYAEANSINNVRFVGFVGREKLGSLITNARFTVVPSEWYENAPLSVLESYAAGKPVIAARIGGLPELVEPGVTGDIFEPGNQDSLTQVISRLYGNKRQTLEMGRMARRKAENEFSLELHHARLMSEYEKIQAVSPKLG